MIARKFLKKFFFVHIPKTAGTSISTAILSSKKYRVNFFPSEHSTAIEIIDQIGKDSKKYYSFSFVRNPWDRLNSLYYFLCQKKLSPQKGEYWDQSLLIKNGFKAWLLEGDFWPPYTNGLGPSFQKRTQLYFLKNEHNEVLVDDVFKYENLKVDLEILSNKIDVDFKNILTTKSTFRDHYKNDYCTETIDFVNHFHKEDIEKFGYKF